MTARAFVTHGVSPRQVFVPMHYARTKRDGKARDEPRRTDSPARTSTSIALLMGMDQQQSIESVTKHRYNSLVDA